MNDNDLKLILQAKNKQIQKKDEIISLLKLKVELLEKQKEIMLSYFEEEEKVHKNQLELKL